MAPTLSSFFPTVMSATNSATMSVSSPHSLGSCIHQEPPPQDPTCYEHPLQGFPFTFLAPMLEDSHPQPSIPHPYLPAFTGVSSASWLLSQLLGAPCRPLRPSLAPSWDEERAWSQWHRHRRLMDGGAYLSDARAWSVSPSCTARSEAWTVFSLVGRGKVSIT